MRRLLVQAVLFLFVVWLLPLGIFIKASQEQAACGGQRAVCMCHVTPAKSDAPGKPMLAHADTTPREAVSFGGGTQQFLASLQILDGPSAAVRPVEDNPQLYSLLITQSIEHIPKA